MSYIEFSSKPPVPEFEDRGTHMANYSRVYASTKEDVMPVTDRDAALRRYLDTYERTGAKRVILKGRDLTTSQGFKVSNEDVADFCRAHGDRYVGLAGVDPYQGIKAVRDLEHAVRDLGMRGLNLPCFELKLAINDARMYPLYAKCIELDIPVVLHSGVNFSTTSPIRNSHPQLLDEVMVHFPELTVVVSPPGWPWIQELIAVAWRHRSVYIGLAAVRPKYLGVAGSGYESLLQYGGNVLKNQILFGSAFPLMTVEQALADIDALPLADDVRRKWLHDNAVRAFQLDT
ncbi:MAG: amidohydrolase family protein [Ottowia sp.]|uniref:amidohydrolase family protein n=1 Tax=Ottowia sp. TaxID=1898956 RepID=UPI003C731C59